jgi:hypothetical protein
MLTHGSARRVDTRPGWLRWLFSAWEQSAFGSELRSLDLLKANLTPSQRQQFERHSYFDVVGSNTGSRYRISKGRMMNVLVLDERRSWMRCLCFEPRGRLPLGDVMLAQKLALELFEEEALEISNRGDAPIRHRG